MIIGIYKITNPSGAVYIGQSWNITKRFATYRRNDKYVASQVLLFRSLQKYGVENHIFEIIHELPKDVEQRIMDSYEILYMDLYRSGGVILLNLKEGGSYGKHSEESKRKMSLSKIGNNIGEEGRLKIALSRKGKKMSDSTKSKLFLINKGRKWTSDQISKAKGKLGIWMKGRKMPDNVINKIREKNSKPISQFSKTGIFIQHWKSAAEAHRTLLISQSHIRSCVNGKRLSTGGFIWKKQIHES